MEDVKLQETIIKRLNALETIAKRLNTLISLTIDIALSQNSTSMSDKIHRLSDLSLSPAEIGEILNKSTNYITAIIHQKKKRSKK
jgi:hypothetical protein